MNIFKKIALKLRIIKPGGFKFKQFLNSLNKLFRFKSWKSRALVGVFVFLVLITGAFMVYSQSGGGGSIGGSSLNKGLVAHWSLDTEEYEEGTVNLAPYTNYSNRVYAYDYVASCWGGDGANIKYFNTGGYNNLAYQKLTKINSGTGGCYHDNSIGINIQDNKTYIVSVWMKANKNADVSNYALSLNRASDNAYRVGPLISLTTQWQRYSWTYNSSAGHAGVYHSRNIIYNDSDLPLEVYWSGFQVEEKSYSTPYVSGTRIDRVVDKTPYSNNGTNYGATATTDRHGKVGGAMSFNGTSNYVQSPLTGVFPKASFCFWGFFDDASLNTKSRNESAFGDWISSRIHFGTRWSVGMHWNVNNSWTEIPATNLVYGWNHYCLIWDHPNNQKLVYINNILSSTNTTNGSITIGDLKIGNATNLNYYYRGQLDDFRIYNRALSAEEVSLLYGSYEPKTQISSINSGLVGHWTLSEEDYNTSGSRVIDKTPYSNNGINYGATFVSDRHGKIGGAMSFDGVNDYVNLGVASTFFPLNKFTVCSWIKSSGLATGMSTNGIFSLSYGLTINLNSSGNFWARLDDGAGIPSRVVSQNLYDGNFHHLCFLHDGANKKMYIDGILKDSVADTTWTGTTRWPTNSVNIGHENNNPPVAKFNGSIDDVRLYNRALSADEISLLYNSYSPQSGGDTLQKGLVLDMPLTSQHTKTETAGSQIMTDKTPYGNDGRNAGGLVTESYTSFNGTSQYIYNIDTKNPELLEPSAITVSSWINLDTDASTGRHIWFTKWLGYSNEIEATTRLPYLRLNGPGDIRSTVPITPGAWHHFAGTYDASIGGRVYLDGVLVGTKAASGAITHSRTYPLNIGRYSGGIYFKGKIANAKIYNRALSADEIKLLYTQGAADLGGIPNE